MPWKFTWPQSGICTKQYTQKATHTQTWACCTDCPTVVSSPAFRTSQHCLLEQWVRHITLPRDELDTENLKCSRKCLQQSAFMQTFTAVCAHANVYCSLCSCQLLLQSVLMQTFTAILTSASQHVNCEAGACQTLPVWSVISLTADCCDQPTSPYSSLSSWHIQQVVEVYTLVLHISGPNDLISFENFYVWVCQIEQYSR